MSRINVSELRIPRPRIKVAPQKVAVPQYEGNITFLDNTFRDNKIYKPLKPWIRTENWAWAEIKNNKFNYQM